MSYYDDDEDRWEPDGLDTLIDAQIRAAESESAAADKRVSLWSAARREILGQRAKAKRLDREAKDSRNAARALLAAVWKESRRSGVPEWSQEMIDALALAQERLG